MIPGEILADLEDSVELCCEIAHKQIDGSWWFGRYFADNLRIVQLFSFINIY